eukprot:PITA_23529
MGWRIHQMDVKIAFLNGVIQEEVYIEQPRGFQRGRESHVCKLKKALYGLKQALRASYETIGENRLLQHCKRDLASEFNNTDMELMHYFLGLEIWQEYGHIFIGQGRYAGDILRIFCMEGCRPMAMPMITNWKKLHASDSKLVNPILHHQFIGSLMYLVNIKPNICLAVNTLSHFMIEPRTVHWVAMKRVFRYLQGIVEYGLDYVRGDGIRLIGCTNSDWVSITSDRKSTFGCCFSLGSVVVS